MMKPLAAMKNGLQNHWTLPIPYSCQESNILSQLCSCLLFTIREAKYSKQGTTELPQWMPATRFNNNVLSIYGSKLRMSGHWWCVSRSSHVLPSPGCPGRYCGLFLWVLQKRYRVTTSRCLTLCIYLGRSLSIHMCMERWIRKYFHSFNIVERKYEDKNGCTKFSKQYISQQVVCWNSEFLRHFYEPNSPIFIVL